MVGCVGGLIVSAVAVAWVVYFVTWFTSRRDPLYTQDELTVDIDLDTESVRILHDDASGIDPGSVEVSTPLTRSAELAEIRKIARTAARRRRTVLRALVGLATVLIVLAGFEVTSWWPVTIPIGLIAIFLGIARFSVVAMHRRLQERVEQIMEGWTAEETRAIVLSNPQAGELGKGARNKDEEKATSGKDGGDVADLATENLVDRGSFWEPIPVTSSYVTQPPAPRTVRTIDLSAPGVQDSVVPTADALEDNRHHDVSFDRPRVING